MPEIPSPTIAPGTEPHPKRRFSFSGSWQQWGICIILHLCLPLLPMGLERWLAGSISIETLYISAAIYTVSIGVTSILQIVLIGSIAFGIILAAGYGHLASLRATAFAAIASPDAPLHSPAEHLVVLNQVDIPGGRWVPAVIIGFIFVVHAAERFVRHVVNDDIYFPFIYRRPRS